MVPFEMLERNCPDEELPFVVPMALSFLIRSVRQKC
jgi:hypothetical protein